MLVQLFISLGKIGVNLVLDQFRADHRTYYGATFTSALREAQPTDYREM